MRVLLINLPALLHGIIARVVSAQPDMSLVTEIVRLDDLVSVATAGAVDVVIAGLSDGELPDACRVLLGAAPQVRVLGIAADARRVIVFHGEPGGAEFGELGPEGVADAIRAAMPSAPKYPYD